MRRTKRKKRRREEEKEEEEAAPAMAAPVAKSFPDWLGGADEAGGKGRVPLPPQPSSHRPGEDKTEEASSGWTSR